MKKVNKTVVIALLLFSSVQALKAQVDHIPFDFNGQHLYISVKTRSSEPLRFIFDTGATNATIDSAAAEKAGVGKENRRTVSVAGSGGEQSYTMAVHQNLKLNNTVINDLDLVLVNFSSLSRDIGSHIDGIVGYEILNKYVTKLDFDQKKIVLYNNIKSADTTGYIGIPFEFSKNILIPRFPISITLANGEAFTGKVMFDTGNAATLLVSTPFSKFHDFNGKLGETIIKRGRGMNAVTQDQKANIISMSFNGFSFGKMGIGLTVNERAEPKDGYLGILGLEVIKRFNVIFDYENKKIYLKPNNSYSEPFKLQEFTNKVAEESKAFLEKNKTQPGVKITPSGLQYKIIKHGNGPMPLADEKVSLQFRVSMINGEKIWDTYEDKSLWVHHLDKALAGVREAVLMMPIGSKWVLYIPSSLAFGDAGYEKVPSGAALIYELEVLK